MKLQKKIFLALLVASSLKSISQVKIEVGGTTIPDNSAMLDISSSSKGLLTPRMTTDERNLISLPATGLLIYNTDDAGFNVYNGTTWKDFTTAYKTISVSGDIYTDTTVDQVATGMTISPPAGTYDINFNSVCKNAYGTTSTTVTKSIGDAASELLPLNNLLKALPAAPNAGSLSPTFSGGTIYPGVYDVATIQVYGTVTLDAQNNPDAIFVFRASGDMYTHAPIVVLAGGAQACNIFWVATGAITIGAGTTIFGIVFSNGAVSTANYSYLEGRMFTTMGAIDFGGGYAHMPTTLSNTIDIGSLANFIMISGGGALSTAATCDFTGGIATKSGAINMVHTPTGTGTGAVKYEVGGTFTYTSTVAGENNIDSLADFSVFQGGNKVTDSVQLFNCNSGLKNINLHAVATVASGEAIEVHWKKTTAKLQLGNRTLTLIKIK